MPVFGGFFIQRQKEGLILSSKHSKHKVTCPTNHFTCGDHEELVEKVQRLPMISCSLSKSKTDMVTSTCHLIVGEMLRIEKRE